MLYVSFEDLLGFGSWQQVRAYLAEVYLNNDTEKKRRADAVERDELYANRGDAYLVDLIKRAFQDEKNRRLRIALVPVTKWNNVTVRITHEQATVYSENATRSVGGGAANAAKYAAFLKLLKMDRLMRELDRMLVLHEDVWVQYRVRELYSGGPRYPTIDLTSPALFDAIAPPRDCTLHVGTLLHQKPTGAANEAAHHYRLITPFEHISLDKALRLRGRVPWRTADGNGFPRMSGFIASTRVPEGRQRLLAISPGADVAAAHKAVWFEDTLLFKESKSVNKQTAFAGDTAATAVGQQQDTESDFFIGEGVQPFPIDRGVDTEQFISNSNHIAERTGANHGLPPSIYNLSDATSGAEVYMRRLPLRELRTQRIPDFRDIERELNEIQAMVNALDLPDHAFESVDFAVDFGEVQQPMTAQESDAVFEKRRQLNLTSTVEEEMHRNRDLPSKDAARDRIEDRIEDEAWRLEKNQALQRMNGSSSSEPGDPTPEQNGTAAAEGDDVDFAAIAGEVLRGAQ